MIAHQHIGMDGNGMFARGVVQQIEKVLSILIVDEDRSPIHTSLGDMKRDTWNFEARAARHAA